MTSVIIPAHNEEAVIGRCLAALLADAQPGELEVLVVANGCTDRTVEIAGSTPGVSVISTPVASKAHALNLGDANATRTPRIYLDADIVLTTQAARATAEALRSGAPAAAPRLVVDLRGVPAPVRAYFRIWQRTGYVRDGLIGSGVYGLSEEGRARFDAFPDIIADDLFVLSRFAPHERRTVDAVFHVTPPRTLRGVVATKTRVFAGNAQYRELHSEDGHAPPPGSQLAALVRSLPPREWPSAALYAGVQAVAKLQARRKARRGDYGGWARDDTGRDAVAAATAAGPTSYSS